MTAPKETLWEIEPHTRAKHEILRRYLEAWFPILNKYHRRIVYIDGFCGPGRYKGGEPGSPIIALEVATNHRETLEGELVFWFIDERQDRIDHLRGELNRMPIPPQFKVQTECGKFHELFGSVLSCLENKGAPLAPTFAFLDPFGFAGIPFSLVQQILSQEHCEGFITFMVDAMNRFLEGPQESVVRHIVDAFGTEDCIRVAREPGDRIKNLRLLYQRQLEQVAKFIRYFEMRDRNDRPQYYLFFATNHQKGHEKMKEAMWRVDPEGQFTFSDGTDPSQMRLFKTDPIPDLIEELEYRFSGRGPVACEGIWGYVVKETPYVKKHMRAALEQLEDLQKIRVEPIKADGTRRRKGTYPNGTEITFL
jgi:three-Cys-motif partner protein